jgi:hypothetical protein
VAPASKLATSVAAINRPPADFEQTDHLRFSWLNISRSFRALAHFSREKVPVTPRLVSRRCAWRGE